MNSLLVLSILLYSPANNTETGTASGGGGWMSLLPLLLIIVVFWLFFIRPQSKKAKEEQKYRDSLKKGDKVVTIGGFHGKVVEVKDTTVVISIAPNTEVEVEKSALVQNSAGVGGKA